MTQSSDFFNSFVARGVPAQEASVAAETTYRDLAGVVVISGKMGSGKDTIAPLLMPALNRVKQSHRFFAAPLKDELNEIILIIQNSASQEEANLRVSRDMQTNAKDHVAFVIDTLWSPVKSGELKTSYDRTEQSRLALQHWGTQVRRAQDENYWVNRAIRSVSPELAEGISVYVTDARFPNELDAVKEIGGLLIRLDVSPEVQEKRIFDRDGIVISDAARNHVSETAVDDYERFDVRLNTDDLDPEEVVAAIIQQLNANKEKTA